MILLCDESAEEAGKCLANLGLIAYNYIKEFLDCKTIANSAGWIYILSVI